MSKTHKILVAQEKDCIDVLIDALSEYELLPAITLSEAEQLTEAHHLDGCVIGIHFDDSHAMELVNFIRNDKKRARIPIVIVRYKPSEIAHILHQTINVLKTVKAVDDYIEADKVDSFKDAVLNALKKAITKHRVPRR